MITSSQPTAMGIHYLYHSLEDMLACQHRAGYESIELWCAAPHVLLTHQGIDELPRLKAAIRSSGMTLRCLTPENCTYPWQYAAKGAALITQSRQYFLHGIQLAAELECPLMAVNSGWGLADEPRDEAMKRSLDMLLYLSQQAQPLGVTLVMESLRPEETNLVRTLAETKAFLDTLDQPNLRPMIDTCAMAVAGETLEDWFSTFHGDIAHLHFVDGTPYGHLCWGDGNRDLSASIATLNKYHYTGALTQEITDGRYYDDPAAADRQNIEALRPYVV